MESPASKELAEIAVIGAAGSKGVIANDSGMDVDDNVGSGGIAQIEDGTLGKTEIG